MLTLGYWSEEGGEANHKKLRHRRLHNARKMDIEKNIEDVFKLQIIGAVPSVLCHLEKSAIPKRKKKVASDGLEDLLVSESDEESQMDLDEAVLTEQDHEMVSDDEVEVEVEELKKLFSDSEEEFCESESDDSDSDEEFFVEESDIDDD